jgi:hypothetical protein
LAIGAREAAYASLVDSPKINERWEQPMFDRKKFDELLMNILKKRGYDCVFENDEVKVTKNGFKITDILPDGEYRVYRNTLNDYEYQQIRAIHESISEAYSLYARGEPLSSQPRYHKLCELGNYVLAATPMELGYMEYVTWQQDMQKRGLMSGITLIITRRPKKILPSVAAS